MDPAALDDLRIQTRVVFRCDGGFQLEIINDRWVRKPCRDKRCRHNGRSVDHWWDRLTGQRVPDDRIPDAFKRPG